LDSGGEVLVGNGLVTVACLGQAASGAESVRYDCGAWADHGHDGVVEVKLGKGVQHVGLGEAGIALVVEAPGDRDLGFVGAAPTAALADAADVAVNHLNQPLKQVGALSLTYGLADTV
jgi:hypothetical protein